MYKERIVIKVGTNVMTNRDNRIVRPVLRRLVKQVAELYERGIISILVSSGSVIAGKEILGESSIENETQRRQVYSAIGQPRMMRHYYNLFNDYGMKCAQVLPTKRDFSPGVHRQNMINCCEGLLAEGVIPIANEDDAVSITMSMFSDNDELASLIAQLINADRLIILTDIDGLYTGHPEAENSNLITNVNPDDDLDKYIQDNNKKPGALRIPVLIKKYVKQNARLVAFNVDPKFNNAVDGLMYIKVADIPDSTVKPVMEEFQAELERKATEMQNK